MNMRLTSSFVALLSALLLTGCLDTNIVDEVSMVRAASFDLTEDNQIKLTANFPTFPEDGAENKLEDSLISATGETTKGARIILSKRSQKPIVFGQLRVLLFSEQLAEQGIETYIDAMYRDPSVGNRIFLAIAEGDDASAHLQPGESGELAGVYLPDLIEHNMDLSILPSTNMHQFLFSLYNDGRDPHLPFLRQSEEGSTIWGTALFLGEKLHSKLDHDDSFILKVVKEPIRQATKQFEILNGENANFVVIENINSEAKRRVDKAGDRPKFHFNIKMDGAIDDYDGEENLEEGEIIDEIESSIEEQLANRAEELLIQFRDNGIDPVGIGETFRSTTRNWEPEKWKNEIYPTVEFNVTVQLDIIQSGAVE
ncbi:Ger(x)C family spore germination protein [Halalkalibacter alkalisediminis]|uniref:Ger(X)C family spore germination protein n=1 Tax=Halalkalibacter alkalisediminis TaxID=935616 RepID=A0ABV6NGD2_9BACI|nr:Ger(x)C family spore germination protein [Halalkalibacter alkalisediminis]